VASGKGERGPRIAEGGRKKVAKRNWAVNLTNGTQERALGQTNGKVRKTRRPIPNCPPRGQGLPRLIGSEGGGGASNAKQRRTHPFGGGPVGPPNKLDKATSQEQIPAGGGYSQGKGCGRQKSDKVSRNRQAQSQTFPGWCLGQCGSTGEGTGNYQNAGGGFQQGE